MPASRAPAALSSANIRAFNFAESVRNKDKEKGSAGHACAMCGEPMKAKDEKDARLMARTSEVLIGVLRHFSKLYYGCHDVTDPTAGMGGTKLLRTSSLIAFE